VQLSKKNLNKLQQLKKLSTYRVTLIFQLQ